MSTYGYTLAKMHVQRVEGARKRSVPFKLSLRDVESLCKTTHCQYTGIEFKHKTKEDLPTFERVNPKGGYTLDNVVIVTGAANCHKSQLDDFMHGNTIPEAMKLKLLRKAAYQIEKSLKGNRNA